MSNEQTRKIEKTETEILELEFGFDRTLETLWRPGRVQASGSFVRPTKPNGFEYECTTGGQTGSKEPKWPTTVSGTISDGSAIWTVRAFGTSATDTIVSANIPLVTGITIGVETIIGNEVAFTVSGGEIGRTYELSIEITTAAGEVLEEKIAVFIKSE